MSSSGTGGDDAAKREGVRRQIAARLEEAAEVEALIREVYETSFRRRSIAQCAVTGWGAVSPAGWTAGALREALAAQAQLPIKTERRCEGAPERRFHPVPSHTASPDWMKQPRFRRTTTVGRHAVHAAVEALGEKRLALAQSGEWRVGIIFCTMTGCVHFSRRFYAEVLENPLLASPIFFPETVHNAPASHLAALIGSREINYTLVGDSAQFIAALDLGSQWLADGLVDACLVVTAEELDWLTTEALRVFGKKRVVAEGAAAVLLEPRTQANDASPVLQHVTNAWTFGSRVSRSDAARYVRQELAPYAETNAVLFDSLGAGARLDKAELAAWQLWSGSRVSVRRVLGDAFAVTSGWQTVAALEWLREGASRQSVVSAVGLAQQAVGAVFGIDLRVGVREKAMEEPLALRERAVANEPAAPIEAAGIAR
jgi:3-oxoacyl-(acyl-carrier-protein) synthase